MTTLDTSFLTTDVAYSNGDLTATQTPNNGTTMVVRASTGKTSGKFYFEATYSTLGGGAHGNVGIIMASADNLIAIGYPTPSWGFVNDNKTTNVAELHQNADSGGGLAYRKPVPIWYAGNVIGIAMDMTAGNIWFSKNGTWQYSGDPGNGTSPPFTFTPAGTVYAAAALVYSNAVTFNFGGTPFAYPIPSDFYSYDGTQHQAPPSPIIASFRAPYRSIGVVSPHYKRL